MQPRVSFVILGCLALFACPGPSPVDCRVGADCASGMCRGDGTCAPVSNTDSGVLDDGGTLLPDGGQPGTDGGSTQTDGGSNPGDGGTDAGMPAGCQFNNDGRIDRNEVFFQAGLRATFKVSGATSFDTAGTTAADGGKLWDFTQALSGDASRLVETRALTGQWFEASFPDAGYVSELSQGSDLLGVFGTTNDALYLQGVVSPQSDGGTEVHYTPWVKVLQFPLQAGASWSTTTDVSGKYEGKVIGDFAIWGLLALPFQQETYTSSVDRAGTANTPYFAFDSLRVRTTMVRSTRVYTLNSWTPILTLRTFSWNSECFGTVAAVTSTDNESSTEFTSAAEVRRLSR